jgi:hypothetical protein
MRWTFECAERCTWEPPFPPRILRFPRRTLPSFLPVLTLCQPSLDHLFEPSAAEPTAMDCSVH